MGAGTAIGIWSLIAGIMLIVFGVLISLTIIGLIIGIPMIILGLKIIAGGAIAGAGVGAGTMAYKGHRRAKEDAERDKQSKRDEIRFRAEMSSKGVCSECGSKLKKSDNFCPKCGDEIYGSGSGETEWECEHCGETFILGKSEEKELRKKGKIKVNCPYCDKKVTCEE